MILIAYDGSDDAKAAIARAGQLMRGARAAILTVWEPFESLVTRVGAAISHAVLEHADRPVVVVPAPEVAAARAAREG
ncbi:MAG TPA: hypothetical protein VMF57_12350 [Solirubrobacteraceae bacterium]|nr:hypothetical protein [Solirubrobacteraceae bacterium]